MCLRELGSFEYETETIHDDGFVVVIAKWLDGMLG